MSLISRKVDEHSQALFRAYLADLTLRAVSVIGLLFLIGLSFSLQSAQPESFNQFSTSVSNLQDDSL